MTDHKKYFQPIDNYFWQWEEGGDVLSIPNGTTIAYTDYVIQVLEHLSAQGIPPFGSLLLAIIATNPDSEKNFNRISSIIDNQLGVDRLMNAPLEPALNFLRFLSSLPKKYKEGQNRLLLFQTIFSDSHNVTSATTANEILNYNNSTRLRTNVYYHPVPFDKSVYIRDFFVLAILLKKFPDQNSIIKKIAGLPLVEEEIIIEQVSHPDTVEKGLIEQLIENDKTFHIGSLIKRLWSGLNIPFHNLLSSDQPMGGFSDLTNKGQFDRLLISEFANEDLVFLSRIANNEALYINREMPPHNNELERMIIIDASIKNWGNPKTIAHALLLAIARHPKTDIHCTAFIVGERLHRVSFDTVDDVIASMQILEPSLHPAKGLELFFKEYGSLKNIEVFFISSEESFQQPPLHRVISEHYKEFNYWIHTDSKGNIDVYKRLQNSKKHVQHIQLPLDELWKKPPSESLTGISIPVNFYPILFPHPMHPKKFLPAEDGEIFMLSSERSLFRLFDKNQAGKEPWQVTKGWQLVLENLPAFDEAEIGINTEKQYLLLLFNISNRKLSIYNIDTGYSKTINFMEWSRNKYPGFIFDIDSFYFLETNRYWRFEPGNLDLVSHFTNSPGELLHVYETRQKEINSLKMPTSTSILKNLHSVFINQLNNMVFNKHELRLTDQKYIKLDNSGFTKKAIQAVVTDNGEYCFNDGSTVRINRSGMLVLQNSTSDIQIFVPSVLGVSLGIASLNDFAGNQTYFIPGATGRDPISPENFWKQYMETFIGNIISHGA